MATLHVYRIYRGQCYGADVIITKPTIMDFQSEPKEFTVSVRTNDIHEAIAKTGTALAALVDEALLSHDPHELDEECEFEEFARDLLRVLTAHSDELETSEKYPDPDIDLP